MLFRSAVRTWGGGLAKASLGGGANAGAQPWANHPFDWVSNPANPWFTQARRSADGDAKSPFLCSLPPGGESLTGVLRSSPFTIPATLTFWLAGHDGYPDKAAQKKNFARLVLADTGEVVMVAPPPRNDVAQKIQWELSAHAEIGRAHV
mgnify:CR=1 FL=1